MDSGHHQHFSARERSYLAVLKKDVHALAANAGYTDAQMADIDIVVAEITSNLIKHAKEGELLVRTTESCIELIGIDAGPGMSDVRRMSRDGMSTTNTLGHGLGTIRRLAADCDIYSLKDWGTIVLARFYKTKKPVFVKTKHSADIHSLIVAKPGETACGDGIAITESDAWLKLMIGDGLGHGPEAQAVVTKAEEAFYNTADEHSPVALLRSIHDGVKRSRGLVATTAVYDFKAQTWHICGVGNIATWVGNGQHSRGVMSYNGIVGVNMPNSINEHIIPHEYGQLVILCSDGFRTRWDLAKYPAILKHDLSILAAAIYKDFARRTDDMSILIARINHQS